MVHINNEILKRMGRNTTKENILNLIHKIKSTIPNAVLRTSLIVGFPGETEEQFNELKEFVAAGYFDKLGVFEYSKEDGTAAAKMKNQILKKVKKLRRNQIMEVQQRVSLENNKKVIGEELDVLVEGKLNEGTFFGRTYKDAPEIDGLTFIESDNELPLGDFVKVKIEKAKEYDLIGKM